MTKRVPTKNDGNGKGGARTEVAVEFLEQLRPGGPWVLTAIIPDGVTVTTTARTPDQMGAFIRKHDGKRNLYYSVNPTRAAISKKAAKIDIAAIEYALADLDPKNDETSDAAKARYLKQLETFQPRPTAVVDSGNGIQALWRLEERIELGNLVWGKDKEGKPAFVFSPEDQTKVDDVEARAAIIMKRLGATTGTQNVDRVLRLPGTTNLPNDKKKRAGRVACPTAQLWFEDTAYPLGAFPNVADLMEAYAEEVHVKRDETGSGFGFRFMRDRRAEGMSYEQAREAILADEEEAGEWAGRVDERQLRRAYERCIGEKSGPPADIKHSGELFDPWAQFIVPEFPLDVLPPVAQEFVVSEAEVIGVDQASMAMCVLSAFSGALSHMFSVKMMRHGNWYASPRLLLYGDASTKKTPTINTATEPLESHQKRLQQEYRAALREHKLALEFAEGDQKPKKSDEPEPPDRLVVYDTTIEKLGEILARNGEGLLVKRDEFSGWIGSMEKYGSRGASANRAFWLQAYDGGSHVVDRIGRGEIFIDNLSVSLLGGAQPERLAELQGLTSDGLLQRFLPTVMGPPKLPQDRPTNTEAYERLVESLIDAEPDSLTLTNPTLEVMREVQKHLHDIASNAGGLARGFQSFVMKLQGVAGSLALILHMAADPKRGGVFPVSPKTMEDVSRLISDFILPHAFEFYRSVEGITEGDRLRRLASWVLTNGKTRFVVSDLTSNIADFRGLSLFEVNKRVSPLVATGWLREGERGPENRVWNVDPRVFSQFAARGVEEEARKAKLAALMNSPRKRKEQ